MKEEIENHLVELINEALIKLDDDEFEQVAESIMDYLDEIIRKK